MPKNLHKDDDDLDLIDLNDNKYNNDKEESEKIEIDKEQALDFLERKSLQLHDALHGWNLLAYAGTILGWAKQTPQGFKNHYPMNWRLRQRNPSIS